jgi:hypothetical protein
MGRAVGTPLKGALLANHLLVRASGNEQMRVLRPEDVNDFLQLLNKSTDEFTAKRLTLNCPEIAFFAGFEQNPTPVFEGNQFPTALVPTTLVPKEIAVSKESATQRHPTRRYQARIAFRQIDS